MGLWALELRGMQGSGSISVALVGTLFHSQDCAPASWLQSTVTVFVIDCYWIFIKLIQQSIYIYTI